MIFISVVIDRLCLKKIELTYQKRHCLDDYRRRQNIPVRWRAGQSIVFGLDKVNVVQRIG